MADQTADLITFIWRKHPELDPEDIARCVEAMSQWTDIETEKNHADLC
jgi:hypothetical protein